MDWLNAAVQGILLGGLYSLFAVGLSLVFGTMRLTNLAHGDLTILPAYFALLIVNALRFNPFYSIPITMVIMFIVGYLMQRGLLNLIVRAGDVPGVIVTFAISMVIQNALLLGFTANSQGLDGGTI
jgi:branched-chain amino acid transport system permease protein